MRIFAATACDYTTPISRQLQGVSSWSEHPPNGQGADGPILLNNILAEFDIPSMDPWGTGARPYRGGGDEKLAYDARDRFLADADHMTRLAHMLDPATGAAGSPR